MTTRIITVHCASSGFDLNISLLLNEVSLKSHDKTHFTDSRARVNYDLYFSVARGIYETVFCAIHTNNWTEYHYLCKYTTLKGQDHDQVIHHG